MVIYLGNGMDSFYFGMNNLQVIQMLGKPNKINTEEREKFIVYYYNEIRTKFYFSLEEDNKLVSIEAFHPDTYLWNRKIIGMKMSEIKTLLSANNVCFGEIEDCDFFEMIFCEEIWSAFYFVYGRLKSIEFSVLCNKNNDFIWKGNQ